MVVTVRMFLPPGPGQRAAACNFADAGPVPGGGRERLRETCHEAAADQSLVLRRYCALVFMHCARSRPWAPLCFVCWASASEDAGFDNGLQWHFLRSFLIPIMSVGGAGPSRECQPQKRNPQPYGVLLVQA